MWFGLGHRRDSNTMPTHKPLAMSWRLAYCNEYWFAFTPANRSSTTCTAPGCLNGPFLMSWRRCAMLYWLTRSGYVSIIAMCKGTPTWSILRFGSGEMTVRPEKSTRLPDRFPRKRPCLPFNRCANPNIFLGMAGVPGGNRVSLHVQSAEWLGKKGRSLCWNMFEFCRRACTYLYTWRCTTAGFPTIQKSSACDRHPIRPAKIRYKETARTEC